ncbi:MFS transporter [Taibaiella chishuiensis]|uniref:Putative MFS family arabinose efflux permease n=1 Tax=Taibaiella chishuiensis TaxID=1434707 RepID=A0A2P8D1R1_9BACT|nr:MFS transporter [Taibaiella chishuiensis]PSK91155.1 putative MFS family arabinose efflux permease [Taibaiella chishuiensis]
MRITDISTFRAFRSNNYTFYFIGRSVSQFGTWMQRTAVVWVIYTQTHSAFMLGLTLFAEQFPSFLFSVFGGIAADRYDRYKIVNITQITSMIQAVLLAVFVITGLDAVWLILLLSVILGIINAYDVPARQSMINEVVTDPADLPSALSLSAATASLAKLLGPALSGIILQTAGAAVCFIINAASFGAVMVSIALMRVAKQPPRQVRKNVFTELAEGFVYLRREASLGLVIVMLSLTGLLVLPYDTLVPVFAKVIFRGDAATYGYISAFIGAGAVAGTIMLASWKKAASLRRALLVNTFILSAGLVGFALTGYFPLAMLFAAVTGFGSVAQFTICNIIIQYESAPEMRGRAISILLTAIFGMLPLGALVIGAVSQHIGAPLTLLFQGFAGIAITLVFSRLFRKQRLRQEALTTQTKQEQASMPQ